MKKIFFAAFALMTTISMVNNASATNITINDGSGSGTGWYNATHEDQEVEPNCTTGQQWDLEGFLLNGTKLTVVGGFNFKTGVSGYPTYSLGDIFIDVNGGVSKPSGNNNGFKTVTSTFGYDYVIDLSLVSGTFKYNVYKLTADSKVKLPYYSQNYSSGPFEYVSGGTSILSDQTATYADNLSDAATGFTGGSHNTLTVDLSFLGYGKNFTASITEGCGNDHMVGQGTTPVPEPATMLLFGTGIVGLAGIARRRRMHS